METQGVIFDHLVKDTESPKRLSLEGLPFHLHPLRGHVGSIHVCPPTLKGASRSLHTPRGS
jgi:hypothetical protein